MSGEFFINEIHDEHARGKEFRTRPMKAVFGRNEETKSLSCFRMKFLGNAVYELFVME